MQELAGFAELPGNYSGCLHGDFIDVFIVTGMSNAARSVEDVTQNVSHFTRNGL